MSWHEARLSRYQESRFVVVEYCQRSINSVKMNSMISSILIVVLKKDWQDLSISLWGKNPTWPKESLCTRSPLRTDFTGRVSMEVAPRKSYYWCSVTEYLSCCIVNQKVYWSHEGRTKVRKLLIVSHCAPLICKGGAFQNPGPSESPGWRI